MKKLSTTLALLVAGTFTFSSAMAADKPFVTVNGQAVSQTLATAFLNEQKAQGAPDTPELQNMVREELVRRALLVQEAKKKGLDKNPEIQAAMELTAQMVLIRAVASEYIRNHPVSDADLKKDYDAINATLGKEFHARHILLEREDEAKAVIARLDKGEKFASLASLSKDPGSKDKEGDLGWAPANTFVEPFAQALQKLEQGKYTTAPVKTAFGYHVILLEDSRNPVPPPFEEVKGRLLQRSHNVMLEKMVEELRSKAKIN